MIIDESALKVPEKPYLSEEYLRRLMRTINSLVDKIAEMLAVYSPTSYTLTTGTLTAGDVTDVQEFGDGNALDIGEVTGVPGYDVSFQFEKIKPFSKAKTHLIYNGDGDHVVEFQMYNYKTSNWDNLTSFTLSAVHQFIQCPIDDYTKFRDVDGNASLRLYHVTSGNAAHNISIDYVALSGV